MEGEERKERGGYSASSQKIPYQWIINLEDLCVMRIIFRFARVNSPEGISQPHFSSNLSALLLTASMLRFPTRGFRPLNNIDDSLVMIVPSWAHIVFVVMQHRVD